MNMSADRRPKVGLAVFVTSGDHPGCVLLGVRKGSHGARTYSPPGGHLEFGESWEECGRREVLEESGLRLRSVRQGTVINAIWMEGDEPYHYIDIVLIGEVDTTYKAEPENLEPHKCEGWEWHEWNNFPPTDRLFAPLKQLREMEFSPFK